MKNVIRISVIVAFGLVIIYTCVFIYRVNFHARQIYIYKPANKGAVEIYDEAIVVSCLQGIINREAPLVYLTSETNKNPDHWLKVFMSEGKWLEGSKTQELKNLDELFALARNKLKGVVIWDTLVPATLNVATTIAGVEDCVVFSPGFADTYLAKWNLPVIKDLRGMFTGTETGSAKNDAYRWAVRNYLGKGLCYSHRLCIFEDSYSARKKGDIGYIVTRDWAIQKRSFVYDLSPWGDEQPQDDPDQIIGTDLATYKMILSEVQKQAHEKEMTEIAGFFAFSKYSNMPDHKSIHEAVPTEWESVYLMSPYNCYQNTVASSCFNQSFHSQAPVVTLKQHRPKVGKKLENKTYLCILMADYDSSTPLYEFLWPLWDDKQRGNIPFIWGINPNLVETYPDLIQYFYSTASENDYFGADASAAGYMNPNRIDSQYLPLFIDHNKKFYKKLDLTISPMVLDWSEPTPQVKDAFTQFSPDGFATIVYDFHNKGGENPKPHVWKGMPVMPLHNEACNFSGIGQTAKLMSDAIPEVPKDKPAFHFFRIVWTSPGQVIACIENLKQLRPDLNIEVLDPYNFNRLFKEYYKNNS